MEHMFKFPAKEEHELFMIMQAIVESDISIFQVHLCVKTVPI